MPKGFFIAGTDTGVGKTSVACLLLAYLKVQGYKTVALKPVASGCYSQAGQLYNQDALLLQEAATLQLPYEDINPYAFQLPIAPHIAAQRIGVDLNVQQITSRCSGALNSPVDYIIVEGAGGFKVPLNSKETMADLAQTLGFPIILVIDIRLGCLNQSLLTYDAIQKTGLPLAGWVANIRDASMLMAEENLAHLKQTLQAAFLGIYPNCFFSKIKSFNVV